MQSIEATIFAGRYQILRCMATGGMGAVYEVLHVETKRKRALKVMHRHLFKSDVMRERFKREARIAADVESDHIIDVSDAGVDEATGTPFFVMELLRGEDLGERLARLGHFDPAEVIEYLYQTASALDRTHAASIVHRDLKPANLFLTYRDDGSPNIKILDFGIAKLVADDSARTTGSALVGTPMYMAPEQFGTEEKLTHATDIYALGQVAYTLLVGKPYWSFESEKARDVIAFALIVARGPQESAVQRAAEWGIVLPPGFDAWFARVTAHDPLERFSSASEAIDELEQVFDAPVMVLPDISGHGQPTPPEVPGSVSMQCALNIEASPNSPVVPPPTLKMTMVMPRGAELPGRTSLRLRKSLAAIATVVAGALGMGVWLVWGADDVPSGLAPPPATASAVSSVIAPPPATASAEPSSSPPLPPAPTATVSADRAKIETRKPPRDNSKISRKLLGSD